MKRAGERRFERQRLAFQLGRDELGREQRPHQPARAEREQRVHAVRDSSGKRQPVGGDDPEADPSFEIFRFEKNTGQDPPQPLDVPRVARAAHGGVLVLDPMTHTPSIGGSTKPPRSTTACGASSRCSGT